MTRISQLQISFDMPAGAPICCCATPAACTCEAVQNRTISGYLTIHTAVDPYPAKEWQNHPFTLWWSDCAGTPSAIPKWLGLIEYDEWYGEDKRKDKLYLGLKCNGGFADPLRFQFGYDPIPHWDSYTPQIHCWRMDLPYVGPFDFEVDCNNVPSPWVIVLGTPLIHAGQLIFS